MPRVDAMRRRRYTVRGSATVTLLVTSALVSAALLWSRLAIGLPIEWTERNRAELQRAEVLQGMMPLTITASGSLQCQTSTRIRCNVYQMGDNGGTQIIAIVPNGKKVKKGDFLFEIDSSRVKEKLEYYELRRIEYGARLIDAETNLANQRLRNKTRLEEARQAVQIARLALEAYDEMTRDVTRAELINSINEVKSQLQLSESESKLRNNELQGVKNLHQQGYRGAAELREAELKYLKAVNQVQADQRKILSAIARLDSFDQFEHPVQRKQLDADLITAKANLRQAKIDNEAQLRTRIAVAHERQQNLRNYDEQIQRYQDQVDNCTVYAPHDGFVVYDDDHDRYGNALGLGSFVRWRETIMHLPNTSQMQVEATVNEAEYRHLEPGQKCQVKVTAYPEKIFSGTVQSVAPIPRSQSRYIEDVQVFEVVIHLDEQFKSLRPGMTSVATIDASFNDPVVQVPVQAVCGGDNGLYAVVDTPAGLRRQSIEIGASNSTTVEVRDGLAAGQSVVLDYEREDEVDLPDMPSH